MEQIFIDEHGAEYSIDKKQLRKCPRNFVGKYDVLDGTEIIFDAFSDCEGLTSINIPDTVITIDAFAFAGCRNLKEIKIARSVEELGWSAFRGCCGLISIVLPSSIREIKKHAFEGCSQLEIIVFEGAITSVEEDAFEGCDKLEKVVVPAKYYQYYQELKGLQPIKDKIVKNPFSE